MDTLTHALCGALIGRATAPEKRDGDALPLGRRMLTGFLAAAFPDIDVVASSLTPLSYLHYHRGVTHSLLLLPVWAALIAFVVAALWRFRPGWRSYFGIAALAVASHVTLDLITSFGTMIFAPVSDARYALGTTFIIDLWFTGLILAGLAACGMWRRTRAPAACALALLAAYVGLQYALQQRAIEFGREYANANSMDAEVSAVPRPVSPFNWTVIVRNAGEYRYAHVNLVRHGVLPQPGRDGGLIARLDAPYRPLRDAQWIHASLYALGGADSSVAREAYARPDFAFFRWFAAYPALLAIEHAHDERCAWFHDLRFVTPGREPTPFRYGMCSDATGAWAPFQLTPGGKRPVY